MNNYLSPIRRRARWIPIAALVCYFTVPMLAYGETKAEGFIEGLQYELLDEVQPVQTGDNVEVVEMFWYGCPHCYDFEPHIQRWQSSIPEATTYVPVPAIFSAQWEFHARTYYTFEALGMVEPLHADFFDSIHKHNLKIKDVEGLAAWVEKRTGNGADVTATFDSFAVSNKLNFARVMTNKYGITGVPMIIVDGRYRTSVSLAGGATQLIDLINFLVEKSKEVRAALNG